MQTVTIALVFLLTSASLTTTTTRARAQTPDACKQCRDQQQACRKNYSSKTCATEFNICMKSCQKK